MEIQTTKLYERIEVEWGEEDGGCVGLKECDLLKLSLQVAHVCLCVRRRVVVMT